MWRSLILVMLLLSAWSARAADAKGDLAEEFVRLLRYADQYTAYHRACLKTGAAVTPESLVKENPNRFEGVRPGMKHWPDVVNAYDKYYEEMCARPTEQEFLSALAKAYAAQLSAADLKASIKFYSSPVGERLIAAHRAAAGNVYSEWSRINSAEMPRASADFDRRLRDIARKASGR
jgi:hypothetical protein